MSASIDRPPPAPPHRDVHALQLLLRGALDDAGQDHDPVRVVDALGAARSDDPDGLAALLADLDVATPGDLVGVLQLLLASAGLTALSWARGLPTTQGSGYPREAVLAACWLDISWEDAP